MDPCRYPHPITCPRCYGTGQEPTFPPSSATLRAFRRAIAVDDGEPTQADAAVYAPEPDPEGGPYGADFTDGQRIHMPAPDTDHPEALPDRFDGPYSVGAVPYGSAPAGAWWAWALRGGAHLAARFAPTFQQLHADAQGGATTAERTAGLPLMFTLQARP